MKKCCKNVPFLPRKRFVLLHKYLETGYISIVAFGDDKSLLNDILINERHFCSQRHYYLVTNNCVDDFGYEPSSHPLFYGSTMNNVKDNNLLNICKNVAEYLSIAEYAMLKKSYFKASSWFEKAKNSAYLASDILDNY